MSQKQLLSFAKQDIFQRVKLPCTGNELMCMHDVNDVDNDIREYPCLLFGLLTRETLEVASINTPTDGFQDSLMAGVLGNQIGENKCRLGLECIQLLLRILLPVFGVYL